jgi:hypothetical protein
LNRIPESFFIQEIKILYTLHQCQNPGMGTRWRGSATSPPSPLPRGERSLYVGFG